MAILKIMRTGSSYRPHWYARVTRNGKKVNVNLKIPIKGEVPTRADAEGRILFDVGGEGDAAFRRSRDAARAEMERMERKSKDGTSAADREKRILRLQTGRSMDGIRLADLPRIWRERMRSYVPNEKKMKDADATFRRFASFACTYAAKHGHECTTLDAVTPEIAKAFYDANLKTYADTTARGFMSTLAGAYAHCMGEDSQNPFTFLKRTREEAQRRAKRKAFTHEQVKRLLHIAENDSFFHPLIVTAACTGMRIGDVCNLEWDAVNFNDGVTKVTTSKTGETAWIPLFPPLRTVLKRIWESRTDDNPKVFPDAAHRYNFKTDRGVHSLQGHIFNGIKPYIGLCLLADQKQTEAETLEITSDGRTSNELSVDSVTKAVRASTMQMPKQDRLIKVFSLYSAGRSYREIASELGGTSTKGSVSDDLRAIEELMGRTIRPGRSSNKYTKSGPSVASLVQSTRRKRVGADGSRIGQRQICDYGWHSFRAAFATLAVEYGGISPTMVKKILGHSNAQMTEDYDRMTMGHEMELVKRRMAATVIGSSETPSIRETVDLSDSLPPISSATTVPERADTQGPSHCPNKKLAMAMVVLSDEERKRAIGVLNASGIEVSKEADKAFAVIKAVVGDETRTRIEAVIKAAGL